MSFAELGTTIVMLEKYVLNIVVSFSFFGRIICSATNPASANMGNGAPFFACSKQKEGSANFVATAAHMSSGVGIVSAWLREVVVVVVMVLVVAKFGVVFCAAIRGAKKVASCGSVMFLPESLSAGANGASNNFFNRFSS